MDDFVAYNKRFAPLVAACGYNGAIQWGPLYRGDLFLIDDSDEVPGGWIMAKDLQGGVNGFGSDSTSQSFKRVYLVIRGMFMFCFFNPQEDPSFLVPIGDCDVVLPDRDAKIFDDRRLFKANEGFEFDIYFKQNGLIRISSLTDKERKEWTHAINNRKGSRLKKAVEEEVILSLLLGINSQSNETGNVITTTRLIGQSRFVVPIPSSESVGASSNKGNDPSIAHSNSNNNVNHTPFSNLNTNNTNKNSNTSTNLEDNVESLDINNSGGDGVELGLATYSKLNSSNLSIHSEITDDFLDEARSRLANSRAYGTTHEVQEEARNREMRNPMTLSSLFRMMLFFFDEPLVEDAIATTNNSIKSTINRKVVLTPHVKGQICEHMLTTVYQHYCEDDGFMNIEQLDEFMFDSAILNTHAPRDDNDEPLPSYRDKLAPITLLDQVPKDLGYARSYVQGKTLGLDGEDMLSINFAQFYQILIIITSVVYPELSDKDLTLALNKLLQEAICPLYGWCIENNCKRGSVDVLVQEDRIPLLLITYAPNLWRVFLMYATDVINKPAELSLAFPEIAQVNEKIMFGVASGFPFHSKLKVEPLYMTESAVLRFCTDYALAPHVLTKSEMREIYAETNRAKHVASVKLSTRDQAPTNSSLLKTSATQIKLSQQTKSLGNSTFNRRQSPTKATAAGGGGVGSGFPPPPPPQATSAAAKVGGTDDKPRGLGFSEFVEFICKVATRGMEKENYHSLFPTPFSKVLSILTIWGIADMKKLEEVRILHNSEKIVVSA